MSDRFTSVEVDGGGGLGQWGHMNRVEAIRLCREYYERELKEAQNSLKALDEGRVKVFHQYGPYAAARRVEVTS